MGKKILMIIGDFTEDYETHFPYQAMLMLGHECHCVCPGKKKGDFCFTAVHDFDGAQTYSEKQGHRFVLNYNFDEVNPADYDGLLFPGGRSCEYLRLNKKVLELTKFFDDAKKPIAAICHGPQIPLAAGICKGRKLTAYPACEPEVVMAGAEYIKPNESLDNAYTDGNLVTGPAWPANGVWIAAFVALLK